MFFPCIFLTKWHFFKRPTVIRFFPRLSFDRRFMNKIASPSSTTLIKSVFTSKYISYKCSYYISAIFITISINPCINEGIWVTFFSVKLIKYFEVSYLLEYQNTVINATTILSSKWKPPYFYSWQFGWCLYEDWFQELEERYRRKGKAVQACQIADAYALCWTYAAF